tara:strand:- start:51741 stop:52487 length:747 start_codon:yes stop_codon:yes gene_type:complete
LKTLFTGKIHTHVEETTSTNELAALALKSAKVIEGAMFSANNQTKGKGQRGRVWESHPGQNILVSYVFFPVFLKASEQFALIKAVSLTVKDLLDKYLMDKVKIKWPNDIYVNDLKIAGILIESSMKGDYMGSSIIGIGLNVNQKNFGNVENGTSVILETGKGCDVNMFRNELSYHLERRYRMLKKDPKSMDGEYQNALYRRNIKTKYLINDSEKEMTLIGVDDLGQIVLQNDMKQQIAFAMHQVRMII